MIGSGLRGLLGSHDRGAAAAGAEERLPAFCCVKVAGGRRDVKLGLGKPIHHVVGVVARHDRIGIAVPHLNRDLGQLIRDSVRADEIR